MSCQKLKLLNGFAGRPICCAKPMQSHSHDYFYPGEPETFSTRFICPSCRKTLRLYYSAPGKLHQDQTRRDHRKAA